MLETSGKFKLRFIAAVFAIGFAASPLHVKADSTPLIGEIKIVGFTYCPASWEEANGQLLQISSNTALFSILGTTYGGDGRTTFALPDLRGRVVLGDGLGPGLSPATRGNKVGSETAELRAANLPKHTHAVNATNADGDRAGPGGKLLGAAPPGGVGTETIYSDQPSDGRQMAEEMITESGEGAEINVIDPRLGLLHCIAAQGIFPTRN